MTPGLPCYIVLQALEDTLKPLAAPYKGQVDMAHDPAHAMEMLANAPQAWRVIVGVDDETSPETNPSGKVGVSETEFFTIIQAGVGLASDAGKQVHRERTGGAPSVLELAEAVRGWMRGIRFEHPDIYCQSVFAWKRSTWVSWKEDGKPPVFARQHVFTLQHNISAPVDLEPQPISYP